MKGDLISRKAAIDAIEQMKPYQQDADDIAEMIDNMPSAKQWIPVTERLPEDEEEVIVSVRDDSGDNTLDYSSFGWYACACDFWVVDNEANERVVAWMPLPKPWKGEQNE